MSIEEAAELARRAIYHATFRDAASGGVASGMLLLISNHGSLFKQSYANISYAPAVLSMLWLDCFSS